MQATLEDVARQVVGAVDGDFGYPVAAQWVMRRYEQLATRTKLRHLRQVGQCIMPATVVAGKVTATRDSAIITGDATATAAWNALNPTEPFPTKLVGWHIRVKVAWYEIIGYQTIAGVGTITLRENFAEDTSTLVGYWITLRWVPLSKDAIWLGHTYIQMRRRMPINLIGYEALDLSAPSRPRVGYGPDICAEAPETPDGIKRMEFYPYTTTSEAIFYLYWKDVPLYSMTDPLPPRVRAYALKEGALIDAFRYLMSQALKKEKPDLAATWRNEARTQETKWEQYLRELIRADRSEDDATFILKKAGIQTRAFDIQTAVDEIYARWPR